VASESSLAPADRRVVRVSARIVAQLPFRRFALRAIAATNFPGATPEELYDEIAAHIDAPNLAVFLGLEGKQPRALFIGMLPSSRAMMAPQAVLVYSERPALSRLVGERVRKWLRAAGHDRIIGMNLNHKDAPFLRAFRHCGAPRVIGSVVEVRV
jgi:hypothetical protein